MWRINVHFLTHLPDMVDCYGPLPVQTGYYTENTMGLIARRVKTGTIVSQQVMNKFITYQSVVSACSNNLDSLSSDFRECLYFHLPKLSSSPPNFKSFEQPYHPSGQELSLLKPYVGHDDTFKSLQRFRCNGTLPGQLICTKSYNESKATSTNNHCIKTVNQKYFLISKIVQSTKSSKVFFFGHQLLKCEKVSLCPETKVSSKFSYVSTFSKISPTLSVILPSDFLELSTYANINDKNYVFNIFNRHM